MDSWFAGGSPKVTGDAGTRALDPPSKLHFNPQEARALLGPIVASLTELERRAERFGHVAALDEADAAAVAAAHAALVTARNEVQRLWRGDRMGESGRSGLGVGTGD